MSAHKAVLITEYHSERMVHITESFNPYTGIVFYSLQNKHVNFILYPTDFRTQLK